MADLPEPTLEGLLAEVGIPSSLLDQRCSNDHLTSISLFLDWRRVAPHLGLDKTDIEEIESKTTEPEKRLETLKKWTMKKSYLAKFKVLVDVLLKVGCAADAERVCRLLQPQVSPAAHVEEHNSGRGSGEMSHPEAAAEYAGGSGVKLGDIAKVKFLLSAKKVLQLKPLHKLCYNQLGTTKVKIMENLLAFSGFCFKASSKEYQKKKADLTEYKKSELRPFLEVLALPLSGSKEEQVESILQFLLCPVDLGKPIPKALKTKPKRMSSDQAGGKPKKSKLSNEENGERANS